MTVVDIAKATKSLENYFANVTKEQFATDLRRFCPELFEEEGDNDLGLTHLIEHKIGGSDLEVVKTFKTMREGHCNRV